jgi:hypothetical protein
VKGQRRLQTQIARVEAEMELPLPGCINSAHRCSLRSMLSRRRSGRPDRVGPIVGKCSDRYLVGLAVVQRATSLAG